MSLLKANYLLFGPYVGDFENEIMTFRPYMKWISKAVPNKGVFVNTHYNRTFMYDKWAKTTSIDTNLTQNEQEQINYYHRLVDKKNYNIFIREFKEQILKFNNIHKKECKFFNLNYIQSTQPYPIFQKIFEPIPIPDIEIDDISETILYIPHINEDVSRLEQIFNILSKEYKILVVGDKKIHLQKENIILQKLDYLSNVYQYIIKYMSQARAVICPASHWTFLSNLQNCPVFSWGENISIYKQGGPYYFKNYMNSIISTNESTNINTIIKQCKWFLDYKISGGRLKKYLNGE